MFYYAQTAQARKSSFPAGVSRTVSNVHVHVDSAITKTWVAGYWLLSPGMHRQLSAADDGHVAAAVKWAPASTSAPTWTVLENTVHAAGDGRIDADAAAKTASRSTSTENERILCFALSARAICGAFCRALEISA